MQKKFKLIKTYPGSPELGTILEEIKLSTYSIYKVTRIVTHSFPANWIENNPEFWEEVVEKDYEILKFLNKDNNNIYFVEGDMAYTVDEKGHKTYLYSRSLEYCNSFYSIHSVKRLSDGEIFTIGDKCTKGIIKAIYRDNRFSESYDCALSIVLDCVTGYKLKELKKAKPILFTTEDGVDIYEGDTAYMVCPYWQIDKCETNKHTAINRKWFSTKEAAENYILWNKPCLSINDVNNCYNCAPHGSKLHNNLVENLKELVKSKL